MIDGKTITHLLTRLKITDVNKCWEYQGYRNKDGHSTLTIDKVSWKAHRLMYTITYGNIPNGKIILHTCNIGWCCNPMHLYVATEADGKKHMCNTIDDLLLKVNKNGSLPYYTKQCYGNCWEWLGFIH